MDETIHEKNKLKKILILKRKKHNLQQKYANIYYSPT